MIVVTGSARTGTSMMMQTLKILGIPVLAPEFLDAHESIKEYNVKGFYEDLSVGHGVKDNYFKGTAVKLFGGSLHLTNEKYIDKIIICKRRKEDACKSYVPILKRLYGDIDLTASQVYESNYRLIKEYSKDISTILINFEDMIASPEKEISRLVEFLKSDFDKEKIHKAISNINI